MSALPYRPDDDDFLPGDPGQRETQPGFVAGEDQTAAADLDEAETHEINVGSGPDLLPGDQSSLDPHIRRVAGEDGPFLSNPTLYVTASMVDDLEAVRKAAENRIRQLTRSTEDSDGEVRGHGMPDDHPVVLRLKVTLDEIAQAEASAVKALEMTMARHPLGPWVKAQNGLGLKTMARLLSAVGDPYWNTLHQRPRTVSELWAYCGLAVHDGHAQRRAKGQKSNWSDEAKMRAWNVVQPIIKNVRSPYRRLYDAARAASARARYDERYAGRQLKGKPIEVGDPIPDGHLHARAVRTVMKAVLKDLWVESKRLHEERGVTA